MVSIKHILFAIVIFLLQYDTGALDNDYETYIHRVAFHLQYWRDLLYLT